MKTNSEQSQASKTCAEVLFLLCILVLIAVWFLNRTLVENKLQFLSRWDWYQETGSMLGKIRAYRARNADLFTSLTFSALSSPWGYDYKSLAALGNIKLWHDPVDGHTNDERLFDELGDAARTFGEKAAAIAANAKDHESRTRLLIVAVSDSFKNTEARRLLEEKAVAQMSKIDEPEEWLGIVSWIVFSDWPPVGHGYAGTGSGTSYANRFPKQWDSRNGQFHIYTILRGAKSPADAEAVLESYWQSAYAALKEIPNTPPQVGVPGIGLTVSVNDLVMLAGPVLVFFQVLFLILWERQNSVVESSEETQRPFIFPVFASPSDPLHRPSPKGLSEFAQRAIWSVFLILPVTIISFGILTRYDAVTTATHLKFYEKTELGVLWIGLLFWDRGYDFLSACLDFVNLACLAVSLLVLIRITTSEKLKGENSINGRRKLSITTHVLTYLSPIGCIAFWFARLGPFRHERIATADLWLFTLFGLVWALIFPLAVRRGAKLVSALSFAGMVIFLLLLL